MMRCWLMVVFYFHRRVLLYEIQTGKVFFGTTIWNSVKIEEKEEVQVSFVECENRGQYWRTNIFQLHDCKQKVFIEYLLINNCQYSAQKMQHLDTFFAKKT